MGEQSKIEWTHHTFNPWWGCFKVSDGCKHCYADTLAKRYGHNVWGPAKSTSRRMMSDKYWQQPLKWNASAAKRGVRERVFCASMADVFEDHPDVTEARSRLFDLIEQTPNLIWLLLTKRPENIKPMLIEAGRGFQDLPPWVWIGTSVENQEQADARIPHLLEVPAGVRFLSCEPLLGPIDLSEWIAPITACGNCGRFIEGDVDSCDCDDPIECLSLIHGEHQKYEARDRYNSDIHWIIAGGESGHGARPMHPDWARLLRDQCTTAGVAFFFKQWGEHLPLQLADEASWYRESQLVDGDGVTWARVGKGAAGRLLDGCEWSEFPEV